MEILRTVSCFTSVRDQLARLCEGSLAVDEDDSFGPEADISKFPTVFRLPLRQKCSQLGAVESPEAIRKELERVATDADKMLVFSRHRPRLEIGLEIGLDLELDWKLDWKLDWNWIGSGLDWKLDWTWNWNWTGIGLEVDWIGNWIGLGIGLEIGLEMGPGANLKKFRQI